MSCKLRESLLAVLLVSASLAVLSTAGAADFVRGDVDMSGDLEISDSVRIIAWTFLGGPEPTCLDSADVNDSAEVDVSDAIYLLAYLFRGGSPPPLPFPVSGVDPTADDVDCANDLSGIRRWNRIAVDSSGLDHSPLAEGEVRVPLHQPGPGRSSRAMAIVHIAMFEVVNAVESGYVSHVGLVAAPPGASLEAAIAQAAHDTLVALFPSHAPRLAGLLDEDLAQIDEGVGKVDGIALGRAAAAAITSVRAGDGADHPEPRMGIEYIPGDGPGIWRQDPISRHPLALGARWSEVAPFVMTSASQFRAPPPPALDSPDYATAYDEVQRLGGDGITTPTERTDEGTEIGTFWAYDGMPSLCAPPRLYNQITLEIAEQMGSSLVETARLLALVNVAMADAGIAVWESKYHYVYWRPVAGIREAKSGAGDGNPLTSADPTYSPLGAPASNLDGPNFTPPFPAYPSGHAGFGGALFQTLRRFYGTDEIPFQLVSDEFNGMTRDHSGNSRPMVLRSYPNLSTAEEENGQSRIYLGIHWSFDKTEGIRQGRRVADLVVDSLYPPE